MTYLNPGDLIPIENGTEATVIKKLGEGGRVSAYLVDYQGELYALKLYFRGNLKDEAQLRENVSIGSPGPQFLWPLFLAKPSNDVFGYLQKPVPEGYTSFSRYLMATASFQNTQTLICAGLHLIIALRDLHQVGLAHRNLDSSSFLLHMKDGDVLICDCDSIVPFGCDQRLFGTVSYMAPEFVRADGGSSMTSLTDANKHTAAVLLFRLLTRSDPLEGKKVVTDDCLTGDGEEEHYGKNPIFIFDPKDNSNRPVPGVHNNAIRIWPMLPDYIQKSFITVFTEGLMHPEKRLSMSEWEELLLRMKDDLVTCPNCGKDIFISTMELAGEPIVCPKCSTQI